MRIFVVTLVSALVASAVPALAEEDCRLNRVTSVDMGVDAAGGVTVPISVGGHPFTLLIDTGGADSMLSETAVAGLGLRTKPLGNNALRIYGGTPVDKYVDADDVIFGTLKADHMGFLVLPDSHTRSGIDGTLAPDILRAYDDDFDFANAKFSLFSQDHCLGKVVWWTSQPASASGFMVDRLGQILFHVELDGKPIWAILDTGSSISVLRFEDAESMYKIDPKSPGMTDLAPKVGQHVYRYPFQALSFGGVTVSNPLIDLVPDDVSRMGHGAPTLIVGMGILRQLHLYIAYREKKLYATSASAH